MGYTHYWRKIKEIDKNTFSKISEDFRTMVKYIQPYIDIRGWDGEEKFPTINENEISFNGNANCGHISKNLGIAWAGVRPNNMAYLIEHYEEIDTETLVASLCNPINADIQDTWYAGAKLNTRQCNGDCSHETMCFERVVFPDSFDYESARPFNCCKTAYKPYDMYVIILLIIAKNYMKDDIKVSSDGELCDWQDGAVLCQKILGYGLDFDFENEEN